MSVKRIIATSLLLFACLQNTFAWTARDANDRWTLTPPDQWYGGSYHQMRAVISAAEQRKEANVAHIQILRTLAEQARGIDAVLFHLETTAGHGDASFVKINTTSASGFPPIAELTADVWTRYGQRLLSSTPGARDVQLIRHQEDIVIRGNRIATAGFKIIKEANRNRYDGTIIIYRPSGITSFNLDAPWDIAGLRLEEMWTMVRSIEFRP